MKTYQIWTENHRGEPLTHDYDAKVNSEVTELYYSNSTEWTSIVKNTSAGKMTNSGNDLIVEIKGVKKIVLDYQQAHQLYTLLAIDCKNWKNEIRETTTIKQF